MLQFNTMVDGTKVISDTGCPTNDDMLENSFKRLLPWIRYQRRLAFYFVLKNLLLKYILL